MPTVPALATFAALALATLTAATRKIDLGVGHAPNVRAPHKEGNFLAVSLKSTGHAGRF
jgi:hypothetical protein